MNIWATNSEDLILPQTDRSFRPSNDAEDLYLTCAATGAWLAGVPLLRTTPTGLAPRAANEIGALMKSAYGQDIDPARISPGLDVMAKALNNGDMGRALVAAAQLRLPRVEPDGAARLARADQALSKYDPNEPRDERGRWTSGDGGSADTMRPTPVGNPWGPGSYKNANPVCVAASQQCQITALSDKGDRNKFFSACQEAEDMCYLAIRTSQKDVGRDYNVIFPDHTVVKAVDGVAIVTHIGGTRLPKPLGGGIF